MSVKTIYQPSINNKENSRVISDERGYLEDQNLVNFIENCIHGIYINTQSDKVMRGGALVSPAPTIVSRLSGPATPWCFTEFLRLGQPTFLIPGPMTIMDGCYNGFYNSNQDMVADVVRIIQMEVLALIANGCDHIIINEPAFADYPDKANEYGADDIIKIFSACPETVRKEIKLNLGKSVSPSVMRKLESAGIRQVESCNTQSNDLHH